jgi:hypothetical protein
MFLLFIIVANVCKYCYIGNIDLVQTSLSSLKSRTGRFKHTHIRTCKAQFGKWEDGYCGNEDFDILFMLLSSLRVRVMSP